jgi:hypothetical protein
VADGPGTSTTTKTGRENEMCCQIIITMEGGIIQDVLLFIGVRLIVRDYDVSALATSCPVTDWQKFR